jgi:hypothetical protein
LIGFVLILAIEINQEIITSVIVFNIFKIYQSFNLSGKIFQASSISLYHHGAGCRGLYYNIKMKENGDTQKNFPLPLSKTGNVLEIGFDILFTGKIYG